MSADIDINPDSMIHKIIEYPLLILYMTNPPASENRNPPIVPSHVFFGEIRLNNKFRPKVIPVKYENVSLIHTMTKSVKIFHGNGSDDCGVG